MFQQVRHVVGQQVAAIDEVQRGGGELSDVFVAAAVALLNRQPRVTRLFAFGFRSRKRNVGADLPGEPIGRADGRVAIVPAGLRRERHGDVREPDAGPHVSVGVHGRHADDERLADLRRLDADDPPRPVGTEIQMECAQRLLRQREPGHRGPPGAAGRRQRAVGDPRIRARRRRHVVGHPAIERAEQRANGGRVVERVERRAAGHAAADVRFRPKRTRTVRRRRDHVDAGVRRKPGVLRAGRIGVHERAGAVEVLRARQQVEDLRRGAGALRASEQAVHRAGFRIRGRSVGEGEQIDGKQDVEVLQRVP